MEKGSRWNSKICPRILEKLEVIEKQAASCWGYQSDHYEFQIRGLYGDQQKVDLQKRSCSCRRWDLTGIPCKHAVCAIWLKKLTVHEFVHPCYSRETYMQIYAGCIHPMAGPAEWSIVDRVPPLPPVYKARAGRPKKLRKKSTDELTKDGTHVARTHITLHCTKCRKPGHNSRRCPDYPKTNSKNKQKQMKPRKRVGVPVCVEVQNIGGIETNAGESSELGGIGGESNITVVENESVELQIPLESEVTVEVHESVHIVDNVHVAENVEPAEVAEHEEPVKLTQQLDIYTMEGFDFEVFDYSTLTQQDTLPPIQPVSECLENAVKTGTHMTAHGVKISFGPPPPTKKKMKTNLVTTEPRKTSINVPTQQKRKIAEKKYWTRSAKTFKSHYFGNNNDPVNLD